MEKLGKTMCNSYFHISIFTYFNFKNHVVNLSISLSDAAGIL